MKKDDGDKAGISTGTTKIEPMGNKENPGGEFGSSKKSQKPTMGGKKKVSRGQTIKC